LSSTKRNARDDCIRNDRATLLDLRESSDQWRARDEALPVYEHLAPAFPNSPRSREAVPVATGAPHGAISRFSPSEPVSGRENNQCGWISSRCGLSPLHRYRSTASLPAPPTSDPILEVEHPNARLQPKLGQQCRRQQGGMGTSGTIDLHEAARPEILDPGRIKWHHVVSMFSVCSGERIITSRDMSSTEN
jgi:hypothetical protein